MRWLLIIFTLLLACREADVPRKTVPYSSDILNTVSRPPAYFGLGNYYHKYLDAAGIPIFTGIEIPEFAIQRVKTNVAIMLAGEDELKRRLVDNYMRIVILALIDELDTLPEFAGQTFFPDQRSYPATFALPIMVLPEENILCFPNDPSEGEDVFVRSFALSLLELAIPWIEPDYRDSLTLQYEAALAAGLWQNTLAAHSVEDYFAEGVQSWFNVNREADPTDGAHNQVDTRLELAAYDPALYDLLDRFFDTEAELESCSL